MTIPLDQEAKDFHFQVTIMTREEILYSGLAENVTSINDTGEFDVLKLHANFISLIKDMIVIRQTDGKVKEFAVNFGVMHVKDNVIDVFMGTGETLGELVGKES